MPRRPLNKSGVGEVGRALQCSSCTAAPVCSTYLDGMIDDIGTSYEIATYQQTGWRPPPTRCTSDVAEEVNVVCRVLDHLGWNRA